ncbi:hypothetical protein ACOAKG_42860 [Streptomyces sp. JL3001]|uniref:hypothetical protein n=1 Tax=Streptomyces sp. JL3001 TaxID=3400923 RepID=UPI003B283A88
MYDAEERTGVSRSTLSSKTPVFQGYGRPLSDAEERALAAFAEADAAGALAYGPRHADLLVTARGRRTVERLMREGRR